MDLSKLDFGFYAALFRRRLPLFLAVTILCGTLFVALTLFWPTSYQATAKVLVESPQIPVELAKSTVPTSAGEQFQIIQQDVLSRPSLLALADQFDIYADRPDLSRTDRFEDMVRRIGIVPTPIDTGTGRVATIYNISFRADTAETAANLVNELVSMILSKDVQLRTARATDTVSFFTKEKQRLDVLLRDLDTRILDFKNQHINALPESIEFRRSQQVAQQQRLLNLGQEAAALTKRHADLLARPFELATASLTPEEQGLQSLRQALAQQQATFAEDSPTIQSLRRRIAAMEEAITKPAQTGTTPVVTSRELELGDIKDRLAEIAEERSGIERSIAALSTSIEQTPANETVLNSMSRDHQNLQAQYDAAIARLAEASTGQQIELLLKGERLSLIESAEPPHAPQGPSRKLLLVLSAAVGLMLGLAAVLLPELLNRRIRRPVELANRLQIMPFVTVPYIERRALRTRRLAVAVSILLAVLLLPLVLQSSVSPVNDVMDHAPHQISPESHP